MFVNVFQQLVPDSGEEMEVGPRRAKCRRGLGMGKY
jgi:hypothetical protein